MKLTVKTLKGEKFVVEADDSQTVSQVKGIIESQKPELPAAGQKLIHSGKVLKDEDALGSCGIKENDFLVVMVTKPKKAAAPKPAAAAAAAPKPVETKESASAAAPASEPTPKSDQASSTPASETPAAASTSASTPAAPTRAVDAIPEEAVTGLIAMGFPEAEVRHCLRAAHGNPDIAVEFLTNGIPDGVAEAAALVNANAASNSTTPAAAPSSSGGGAPLQALRNHPQFDALRRLVQSNPGALQQVLTQIGQQQPDLLAEINANQALFLEMMNEPVGSGSSSNNSGGSSSSSPNRSSAAANMMGGPGSPAQMAQMIQSMSETELQQMANMMGLSPEQLRATAQMIGSMPSEQLDQFMSQAMGGALGGGMGGGGGGPQVLRLTEEEMAAVDRLAEMGFDRSEAAQAFLACDKNEALAANLLMDSMGSGGFFGGGGGGNDGGGGDNNDNMEEDNNDGNDADDDENMYD